MDPNLEGAAEAELVLWFDSDGTPITAPEELHLRKDKLGAFPTKLLHGSDTYEFDGSLSAAHSNGPTYKKVAPP